jgi:hypothetical protein
MRLAWIPVVVFCGCQGQSVLEVSLGQQPFEVREAIFYSSSPRWTYNWEPTTIVVFGNRSQLCQAFEDQRNVCNARLAPDINAGGFASFSRPIGVTESLGWLALRSATEGPALVVQDEFGTSTLGASLTQGQSPALHAVKNRAVIEHFVAGDAATFSFESELSDGRAFRGRIDATWCSALAMFGRLQKLKQPAGASGGAVVNDANEVVGNAVRGDCEGATISGRCAITSTTEAACTCVREGVTSTCTTTPDVVKSLNSCCNMRFGD